MSLQEISDSINVIVNFKRPGVFFRDISPLLANPGLYRSMIQKMVDFVKDLEFDYIAGMDARGFLLITLAYELKK